jgi:hypothetical protein
VGNPRVTQIAEEAAQRLGRSIEVLTRAWNGVEASEIMPRHDLSIGS